MRLTPWEDLKDIFRQYVYTPDGTQKFLEDFEKGKIKYKDMDELTRKHRSIRIDRNKIYSRSNKKLCELRIDSRSFRHKF